MTISTTASRISYNGNGATVAFSFPYRFLANRDIVVVLRSSTGSESILLLGTHYTLSGAGSDAGGTVTMTTAPAVGERLVIYRNVAITQETDYISGDPFPAETHEQALDRLTMIDQQQQDSLDRTLRFPVSDTVSPDLPTQAVRANKLLAFDALGNPTVAAPVTDSSTDVRLDLAASTGSAMVGFVQAGTGAVPRTLQEKAGEILSLKDFGAVGDGISNDYAAIMAAHDNAPDGATILVKGACRFTSPLVFSRRVNFVCPGANDYFNPSVGSLADAITFNGSLSTAGLDWKINIFGGAGSCRNGLVLERFFMSRCEAWVQVGASTYGIKVLGALESGFWIKSSVNFTTPLGAALCAPTHLFIDQDSSNTYRTNANEFIVNLAGSTGGVVIADQLSEGDNTFTGTIQGVAGSPFTAAGCSRMQLREMHFEANSGAAAFTSCAGMSVHNVVSASSAAWTLASCVGAKFDSFIGGLTIQSTSKHTKLVNSRIDGDTVSDSSDSTEMIGGGITSSASSTKLDGGPGQSSGVNFFHNPYNIIWPNGSSSAPAGWSIGSGSFTKNTTTKYPGNVGLTSVYIQSTATALGDMATATPLAPNYMGQESWVSATIALYVPAGQPDLFVYVFNGVAYERIGIVSVKNNWTVLRGSVLVAANTVPTIVIGPYTSAFVAGNYYVGGVSMAWGTTAPKHIQDCGRMRDYIVPNISSAPAFLGQVAVVGVDAYMSVGTSSASDWKKVTP